MSQSAQSVTTNNAASPSGESQQCYTLVSHPNIKASHQQTEKSLPGTTMEDTVANELIQPSSPLSLAPSSPLTPAISIKCELPLVGEIDTEVSDIKGAVSLRETLTSAPSGTDLTMSEGQAIKKPSKRTREELAAGEDMQPALKKPTTGPDVEAIQGAAEAIVSDSNSADDSVPCTDEPNDSKRSTGHSRLQQRTATKKEAAASKRKPACATCKRRKVRCTHNPDERSSLGEANLSANIIPGGTDQESSKSANTKEIRSKARVEPPNNVDKSEGEKMPKKSTHLTRAVSKKPTGPPERTSARTRKAPERFDAPQETPAPQATLPKKVTSRVFDPVYITTNSNSRLGRADMYHMLLEDSAWTSLSAVQQATIISMLPNSTESQLLLEKVGKGEQDTRPQWLKASDVFRDEVAKFKDDLTNGHLAKTWQGTAEQAVSERATGEYDVWKAEEAELWWGQKGK